MARAARPSIPDRQARTAPRLLGYSSLAAVGAVVLVVTSARTPVRAVQTPPPRGAIAGVVRSADSRLAAPGVTVTLRNADDGSTQEAVTDAAGAFSFTGLPAARFLLHAAKPGDVAANYGAPARDKPGLLLALAAGQHVAGLQMSLASGAALAGRIVDESGAPVIGAGVSAIERVDSPYGIRWTLAAVATSDDRGSFRLFGLGDGQYVVAAARPDLGGAPDAPRPADVMFSVQTPARGAPRSSSPRRWPAYSPVFYPGTTDPAAAGIITVRGESDQADLNFAFRMERAGEIEGRLVAPAGVRLGGVRLTLVASADTIFATLGYPRTRPATPSVDGHFTIEGVPRGAYTILATTGGPGVAQPAHAGEGAAPAAPEGWCAAQTAVLTGPFLGLDAMRLVKGAVVSGRVQFVGDTSATHPVASVRLSGAADGESAFDLPPVRTDAGGAFTVAGVPPGAYLVSASVPSATARDRWQVARVTAGGRDALDTPIDVQPGEVPAKIAVALARPTELTGTVYDPAGRPTYDYYVVVFPTDPRLWTPPSHRLRTPERPASDGSFTFTGLLPGDYDLAAVTDFDPGAWWKASFLQALVPASVHVTLTAGETRTQSIRVAGGS